MINIPFYTPAEKSPTHDMEAIVLLSVSAFDFCGFDPRRVIIEYTWEGYDSDGNPTGDSCGFDPETESHYKLGDTVSDGSDIIFKLEWHANGKRATDISYWVPADEYWECLSKQTSQYEIE